MSHRYRSALSTIMLIGACSDPAVISHEAISRDSAGISIVESEAPVLEPVDQWRLSPNPFVEIGSRNGSSGEALFAVGDITRTSDKIVVLNGGSQELRYFDNTGRFLHAAGRRGDGPGEFEGLSRIQVLDADSIVAYDVVTGAASVFDANGNYVSTTILSPGYRSPGVIVLGRLTDGTYLTRGETHAQQLGLGPGRVRGRAVITHLDEHGGPIRDVVEFADRETMALIVDGRRMFVGAPFGRRQFSLLVGDDLVLGNNATFEFRYHGIHGTIQRIVRRNVLPSVVTPEQVADYKQRYQETRDPARAGQVVPLLEFPQTHPAYISLMSDADANIWVKLNQDEGSGGPTEWSVFDPAGRWITDIQTPGSYDVMYIGSDHLFGVWRDDLGVEYVRGYELINPNVQG